MKMFKKVKIPGEVRKFDQVFSALSDLPQQIGMRLRSVYQTHGIDENQHLFNIEEGPAHVMLSQQEDAIRDHHKSGAKTDHQVSDTYP